MKKKYIYKNPGVLLNQCKKKVKLQKKKFTKKKITKPRDVSDVNIWPYLFAFLSIFKPI